MTIVPIVALILQVSFASRADTSGERPPVLAQAASDPVFDEEDDVVYDPLEETNRDVLIGNRFLDQHLFDHLTAAYSKAVPGPLKLGIRNVLSNVDSPKIILNDVLQLEWRDATVATSRFVVNSTIGLAGMFDVAERMGLAKHNSDFGQTLALSGSSPGAYLVLPLLGPNTVRDTVGGAVDVATRPTTYILGPAILLYYGGGLGLVKREQHYQALNALESSSIDFYSALRSSYTQHRRGEVWGRREDRREDANNAGRAVPR